MEKGFHNQIREQTSHLHVKSLHEKLEVNIIHYNRRLSSKRFDEANVMLLNIKLICDELEVDWEVLMNIKSGYLFKRHEDGSTVTTVTEPSQSVTEPSHYPTPDFIRKTLSKAWESVSLPSQPSQCMHCDGSMEGKRPTARFCSSKCKTDYHRKNGTAQ